MSERDKIAVVKERIEAARLRLDEAEQSYYIARAEIMANIKNLLADLENLCCNADEDENEVGKALAAGVCSEDRDDHVPGYD